MDEPNPLTELPPAREANARTGPELWRLHAGDVIDLHTRDAQGGVGKHHVMVMDRTPAVLFVRTIGEHGTTHGVGAEFITGWDKHPEPPREAPTDAHGYCLGSSVRVELTVADETARSTRCRRCSRQLRIRPVREDGSPVATLPRHKPPAG